MNRADLERLDRDALIELAEAAGVTRARILTRPELVDELLLRSAGEYAAKQRARGLFGVARDLLARIIERGLHLPDAADRIRTLGAPTTFRHGAPAALPTVTLAEIYAAQGHRDRAVETLGEVLAHEPDHAAARALLSQLVDDTHPMPSPRLPPETDADVEDFAPAEVPAPASPDDVAPASLVGAEPAQPTTLLDGPGPPARYNVDECFAVRVDSDVLYVTWEARDETLAQVRRAGAGLLALRLVVVVPAWDGPTTIKRDIQLHTTVGDAFVRDLPVDAVFRVAVGWLIGEAFVPIAHSPALEASPGAAPPLTVDAMLRWTPQGTQRLTVEDRDAGTIARALDRARREVVRAGRDPSVGLPGFGVRGSPRIGEGEAWAMPPRIEPTSANPD